MHRVLPTDEGLRTENALCLVVEDGLIGRRDRTMLEREAKVLLDGASAENDFTQLREEDLMTFASFRFRLIERDIGSAEQIGRVLFPLVCDCDANAYARNDLLAVQDKRPPCQRRICAGMAMTRRAPQSMQTAPG